jgi:NADPH:quinone reductase-like Zn-dependent oxidoreductase
MRAVVIENPGPSSRLRIADVPAPVCGPRDLRIRVAAFGVNRGDLLQRRGLYPPPRGASEILGLECAGEVTEVGAEVSGWTRGERAMALLAGGGYAEEAVVDARSAMRVPERLTLMEAAAVPDVFLTVHLCLFRLATFPDGGVLLVQGGAGSAPPRSSSRAPSAGAW